MGIQVRLSACGIGWSNESEEVDHGVGDDGGGGESEILLVGAICWKGGGHSWGEGRMRGNFIRFFRPLTGPHEDSTFFTN